MLLVLVLCKRLAQQLQLRGLVLVQGPLQEWQQQQQPEQVCLNRYRQSLPVQARCVAAWLAGASTSDCNHLCWCSDCC